MPKLMCNVYDTVNHKQHKVTMGLGEYLRESHKPVEEREYIKRALESNNYATIEW